MQWAVLCKTSREIGLPGSIAELLARVRNREGSPLSSATARLDRQGRVVDRDLRVVRGLRRWPGHTLPFWGESGNDASPRLGANETRPCSSQLGPSPRLRETLPVTHPSRKREKHWERRRLRSCLAPPESGVAQGLGPVGHMACRLSTPLGDSAGLPLPGSGRWSPRDTRLGTWQQFAAVNGCQGNGALGLVRRRTASRGATVSIRMALENRRMAR
jgi:hypothetical protein